VTPSPQIDTTQAVLKTEEALPADIAQKAADLARQTILDPTKPETVANLGAASQARAGDVANKLLEKVQIKDAGNAGQLLGTLTRSLKSVDVKKLSGKEPSHLPFGLGKLVDAVQTRVVGYQETLTQIDTLVGQLNGARTTILGDVDFLSDLYDMNLSIYHELQTWIEVAKIKLEELDRQIIPTAESTAGSDPLAAQRISDLKAHRQRLDKKKNDLELTKMLRLQNAPKIRLIQAGNISLAEQLQSSVVNGVPLFKDNLSLAIVQGRQKAGAQIQQDFTDGLNDLIKQGADMLHDNSVQIATQAQRGIIDFATLQHQQEQLLRTIDDVAKIAEDGAKNRETVRQGLTQMESDLQKKLMRN
jgi:uncharacterized protein YaaN involved in tellurite resistance